MGINPTVVNARFVKPLDGELLNSLVEKHKFIFTFEDNVLNGGLGVPSWSSWRIGVF